LRLARARRIADHPPMTITSSEAEGDPEDPRGPATERVRATERTSASAPSAAAQFRRWFWRPPRAHGEIDAERRVSFLELFYDLVYVVVIAQAAKTLSANVTPRGHLEFLAVFGVVWVAWANGTLYYELHGREDGRTRTFVFVQMAILALLAVFTGKAAGESGQAFAVVVIAFLAVMTWLWYTVRRQDREEYMAATARYLVAMIVSIVLFAVSIPLSTDARLLVWGAFSVGWLLFMLAFGWQSRHAIAAGIVATDSMVERFDLLVIIVLGEVVTGVVNGLAGADKTLATLSTGFLALLVGFGLWWIYFDVAWRRLPRPDGLSTNLWMELHVAIAAAIVGAGAAMAGLIEGAGLAQTPVGLSWLMAGSVALLLVSLGALTRTLADYERFLVVYRPLAIAMVVAAGLAIVVGALQPPPWLLATLLTAILAGVWAFAVVRPFKTGTWTAAGGSTEGGQR
jgi:low temperature requirement protein LtrA